MNHLDGHILSGEYDENGREFSIQQVKSFSTLSVLTENQLNQLHNYLQLHQDDLEGQIVTLYDQMPVRLSKEEVQLLISDLEFIKDFFE
ncbi:hypothetical protein ACFYKX_02765 [Cytobacillus sp. FJAT-54145]|uniref:Uncharacterized protein n=1 Tax=Cytobacillus spartinae TaxID=3299023 RepID=A0ABW6K5U1_9BACI